ncbi:MAG: hypothetical protein BIFFINMI_02099 [Phycisphaerae bacterium]|nr:hypothetical protein [Phycisphaerae bacterium]
MDRRTRICIWIIAGGLVNFLLFTLVWFAIGGDAKNGYITREMPSGQVHYYVVMRQDDKENRAGKEVAQGWFIYSAVHSMSIWVTCAAVLLAMLTLAKEHIVNAMSEGLGRALVHVFAFVVFVWVVFVSMNFMLDFKYKMKNPQKVDAAGRPWTGLPPTSQPTTMAPAPRYRVIASASQLQLKLPAAPELNAVDR